MRKNARKYVDLVCENCRLNFNRKVGEYNRCLKKGFSITCSRSCGASVANKKYPKEGFVNPLIRDFAGNRQDEFSSFRYYVIKSKSKERIDRYGEPDITVEYLKEIWDKQGGKCPYTGLELKIPRNTQGHNIKTDSLMKASLDRVDSGKGYVQGNVEFVCIGINLLKRDFSKDQVVNFLSQIQK